VCAFYIDQCIYICWDLISYRKSEANDDIAQDIKQRPHWEDTRYLMKL